MITTSNFELVSIVVTTKNEEKNIANCLQSLRLQTYQNIEILVVDNYSSDNTKAIALLFTDKVFDKGPERSAQRNYGMLDKASGDFLMYVDADMLLSPNLVESCVNHIKVHDCDALHIPERILGCSFICKVRDFERSFYDGTSIDGARFFKSSSFKTVGGFDERLFIEGSGEDWDIDKKIKEIGQINILDKNLVAQSNSNWPLWGFIKKHCVHCDYDYAGIYHNESNFNLRMYLRKKLYYTKGFSGYIKKWGDHDPDIKRQFSLSYRFFIVFFENGKWKRLVSKPNLTIGMYFLRFTVGLMFIINTLKKD